MARIRSPLIPFEGKTIRLRIDGKGRKCLGGPQGFWCSDALPDPYRERAVANIEMGKEVLLIGLGLGITLEMLLAKKCKVTVLEINAELIEQARPHWPKVEIVQGDMWNYIPAKRYDWIVHMGWGEERPNLADLTRRYAPFAKRQAFG